MKARRDQDDRQRRKVIVGRRDGRHHHLAESIAGCEELMPSTEVTLAARF
jgi:hypothetical protein